jgi:hypothetical protein
MRNDNEPGPRIMPERGWKVRFDASQLGGAKDEPAEPAERDVLPLFQAWHGLEESRGERRRSPRYTPAEPRAWVGWWRRGHFVVNRAVIVNLSQGGALLFLAHQPPTVQPVWLCLGTAYPVESVQGRVLESNVTTNRPGMGAGAVAGDAAGGARPPWGEASEELGPGLVYVTRLEFHEPSPSTFFLAAGRRDDGPSTVA